LGRFTQSAMNAADPFAQQLRVLWAAIAGGAALLLAVMSALVATGQGATMPDWAEAAFYLVALGSVLGLSAAFVVLRRMEATLFTVGSDDAARNTIRLHGILALALAEAPTLAAGVAAFVTGELLILALGLPLFGLVWLTWPSDGRVAAWMDLRNR
jgi:hypothetical protein